MSWRSVIFILMLSSLSLPCPLLGAETDADEGSVIFKPVIEGEEGSILEETEGTAGGAFGPQRRYFHPFLSLGSYYTTNLFNTPDEESEWVTFAAPGIWVSLPGSRQPLLSVETLNTAPGGLELTRFRDIGERRFQAYALYRGEFTEHDRFSDAETDDHRAEALLRYNAPGGLWVELVDIYEDDHDPFSTGDAVARELDTFSANRLNPSVGFQVSPKLSFQVDYAWYDLDYDSSRRAFRDREDHFFSSYIFYRLSGKSTAFLDYEHIDVQYDTAPRDNEENRIFAGWKWQATGKSEGKLKLGYGKKKFDAGDEDRDTFLAEVRVNHKVSRKTTATLKLLRRIHESDIQGVRNSLVHRIAFGLRQKLTGKITGKATAYYHRVEYDGTITTGTKTGEREDDSYGAEIAAGFAMARWLNLSGGYVFSERDSNFNERDYTDHTVFLNLTLAL